MTVVEGGSVSPPDGSATSGDDAATIRGGRFNLANYDAKRGLLRNAWP